MAAYSKFSDNEGSSRKQDFEPTQHMIRLTYQNISFSVIKQNLQEYIAGRNFMELDYAQFQAQSTEAYIILVKLYSFVFASPWALA
jgi:hypothetical protein